MSLFKNRYTAALHNYIQTFQYSTKLPIAENWDVNIIQQNRKAENIIPLWWDETLLSNSIFQYGIVDDVKPYLNKPLGLTYNYSDLLCHFYDILKHNKQTDLNYLELGVSVGKNLFTLLNYYSNADLYGFEIEKINPFIETHFKEEKKDFWQTSQNSIKKDPSSLTSYTYLSNKLHYLSGDIWDENSWSKLSGKKFNIIFSDAFHSPDALKFEFQMLMKYELIDEYFFLVWDDLFYGMKDAFLDINSIIKKSNKFKNTSCYLIDINGWLGENWSKHPVGIITNIL